MNRNNLQTRLHQARDAARNFATKAGAVGTGLLASGAAFAQSTSPGSAIAGELSGGKSDVMLVIAAAAVIIGVLVLWSYVKRAK